MAASGGSWKGGTFTMGPSSADMKKAASDVIRQVKSRRALEDTRGLLKGDIFITRQGLGFEVVKKNPITVKVRPVGQYGIGGENRTLTRTFDARDIRLAGAKRASRDEVATLLRGSRIVQRERR